MYTNRALEIGKTLGGPTALWPTQFKYWVGHGQPGPPCSAPHEIVACSYIELRYLYKVLLTLPVTTASVERCFSKLTIVKSKLRSTMTQDRLEALLLASVENDILLKLDDNELVARFASGGERRMMLI